MSFQADIEAEHWENYECPKRCKEEAIKFTNWLNDTINPFIQIKPGKWIQSCGNSTHWTIEQLYTLYKEQKK